MCFEKQNNVAVVIVNYQSASLVKNLLDSLLTDACANLNVYIVDNASGDDSVAVLSEKIAQPPFNEFCELIPSSKNAGFAAGNNLALRRLLKNDASDPDFVWLLNPDTEVKPGALDAMLEWMWMRPSTGICGSQLFAANGQKHHSAFRFHSLLTEALSAIRWGRLSACFSRFNLIQPVKGCQPVKTDWVPGASMLIRTSVLQEVGFFDEKYFLYFEETDFCLATHRAGWSCCVVPQSEVVHIEGQSTGIDQQTEKPRMPAYWFASRRYYFRKNHGVIYALITDFIWIIGYSSWLIRGVFQAKENTDPPYLLRDFIRHGTLANLLRRREMNK